MATWPKVSIDERYSLCFGCGRDNPIGLKLNFDWDGKTARAEFMPTKLYQGWSEVVHGGIIMCLLDEAMAYAAKFEGMTCITARIQAKLIRPAYIGQLLVITSSVTRKTRKLVETIANISLTDGTPVAEGTSTQFVVNTGSEGISRQKAVIWDMDGVIADTGLYHLESWQHVFQKRGINFTESDFRRKFGQRNDTIIRKVLGEDLPTSEVDTIAEEKEEFFRRRVRQNIKSLPGAVNLIKSLKERGFSLALASSGPRENIQLILEGLDITDCFDAIVYGREVMEGKPSPQGFLLAAEKLGVVPKNCAVIEDAVAGVTAAKRAGMCCIAVTNTNPEGSLKEADLVVDSLEKVAVNDLEELLRLQG
jgi:beta-phosphoglucomutase family hydrolase